MVLPAPFGPSRPNTSPWPDVEVDPVHRDVVAEAMTQAIAGRRRVRGSDSSAAPSASSRPLGRLTGFTPAGRPALRDSSCSRSWHTPLLFHRLLLEVSLVRVERFSSAARCPAKRPSTAFVSSRDRSSRAESCRSPKRGPRSGGHATFDFATDIGRRSRRATRRSKRSAERERKPRSLSWRTRVLTVLGASLSSEAASATDTPGLRRTRRTSSS